MKKVLYFHQHFSTPQGSAGTRSYELARHLVNSGHKVTMVCGSYSGGKTGLSGPYRKGSRKGTVDGIDVIEFDLAYANADGHLKRSITFIKFAWRSIVVAMMEKYDVLFATTTPLTAAIPGITARWLKNARFVFEVRDLWPELPRAMGAIRNPVILGAMDILEWTAYKSAHRLIGLSPGIVEGIVSHGIPKDRVEMIPNGCDLRVFSSEEEPWRPEGVSSEDLMAVFTGTHGPANGLDAVLDAATELKKRGRFDIKLVLIGQGKIKPHLMSRAQREGLDNVIFLDPVPKTRLAGLMAEADVGMQILDNVPAFYFGTSPNKFFDYLASGLPVLVNYPGWLAEIIDERRCGFVVPPKNPHEFATALEAAADDRTELKEKGVRSRALAEEQFARPALAEKWVELVTSVAR